MCNPFQHHPSLLPLYKNHLNMLQGNFAKLLTEQNYQGLLIHAGEAQLKFLDDSHYPFKANPHFVYWVPLITHPQAFLWIEGANSANTRPILFIYQKNTYWYKLPTLPCGEWSNLFEVRPYSSSEDEIHAALSSKFAESAYIGPNPELHQQWNFKAVNPEKLLVEIHYQRTLKSEYEQECIRIATDSAVRAHLRGYHLFKEGRSSELEIHLNYVRELSVKEEGTPFDNIVAFNESASLLHYIDYDPTPAGPASKPLHSMLLDAGAYFHGRAADITRTYAFYQTSEFADLVAAMDALQLKIISQLKVGSLYTEHHEQCHLLIAQLLLDFHFVSELPADEIFKRKISHVFFPHGLGHQLGVQVHDVGGKELRTAKDKNVIPENHPYLRFISEIQNGHVFTVEPGLYFIDFLLKELHASENSKFMNWDKIESFKKYGGIRIEDDIIVHDNLIDNITRKSFQKQH
ncbi:MAG: Xaa-Pro dipeptidase [Oligoflexia bacterium]|nr:Xaa-Pro dipeptidase [Oligoflexia bacterium]